MNFLPEKTIDGVKIQKTQLSNKKLLFSYVSHGGKSSIILNKEIPQKFLSLLFLGLGLYLGEGLKKCYKWKSSKGFRKRIELSNSNPNIINCYMKFLDVLGVDKNLISPRIHFRYNGNFKKEEESSKRFWSEIINIPPSKFRKSLIREATGYGKRKLPHGTLELTIYNGVLWHIIHHWIDNINELAK